jgi:hypothetical protein
MTHVEQLEEAVRRLSPDDLAAFRIWFAEYDAAVWDKQFAADVADGKLDRLADEALREFRDGRTSEL